MGVRIAGVGERGLKIKDGLVEMKGVLTCRCYSWRGGGGGRGRCQELVLLIEWKKEGKEEKAE